MRQTWEQIDNTDRGEKIAMRLSLLAEIADPSVLECFAGEGKIYHACYRNYPCVGLDLKAIADGRTIIHIDNRRFLRSADLSRFNVFDLDAYGSPWHQWLIILKRRVVAPGEQIAVFLTDGLDFKMRMSSLPDGLRPYLAIPPGMNVPFLNKHHDFINARIVDRSTRAAGLQIVRALVARNPRGNMRYYALIIKKV
jgi:hypothetical protein